MKIMPRFETHEEVLSAIDNGGRFYNILSTANDSVVTAAELAKAAGVFSSGKNAYLFLSLATANLSESDRQRVISALEPSLRDRYQNQKPPVLGLEEVELQSRAGDVVILEAQLEKIEDKSSFSGFIYTPIMVGEVTTYTMTPIFDCFILYKATTQLTETDSTDQYAYVTTPLNTECPSSQMLRIGGYVRELQYKDTDRADRKFYVEAAFACPM